MTHFRWLLLLTLVIISHKTASAKSLSGPLTGEIVGFACRAFADMEDSPKALKSFFTPWVFNLIETEARSKAIKDCEQLGIDCRITECRQEILISGRDDQPWKCLAVGISVTSNQVYSTGYGITKKGARKASLDSCSSILSSCRLVSCSETK